MPEGPTLVILKEETKHLRGKQISNAWGNAKIDMSLISGQKILEIRTWGKQYFIRLKTGTIRIHFLMFGSYSIDEQTRPDKSVRLALEFKSEAVYFNTCAVKFLDAAIESLYDWQADVMSNRWEPAKARKKLKVLPRTLICDALLDQDIFSGVGNIIKNEVLFRIRLHPETAVGKIPPRKLSEVIKQAREYSFDFLKWKKKFELKKHWLAYTKKTCPRCDIPFVKKYCGKTKRRTFFCTNCQVKYK